MGELYSLLHEISHNFCRLKVMTIEFHVETLFDMQLLQDLSDTQKKNCQLEYIYCSKTYAELVFARELSS